MLSYEISYGSIEYFKPRSVDRNWNPSYGPYSALPPEQMPPWIHPAEVSTAQAPVYTLDRTGFGVLANLKVVVDTLISFVMSIVFSLLFTLPVLIAMWASMRNADAITYTGSNFLAGLVWFFLIPGFIFGWYGMKGFFALAGPFKSPSVYGVTKYSHPELFPSARRSRLVYYGGRTILALHDLLTHESRFGWHLRFGQRFPVGDDVLTSVPISLFPGTPAVAPVTGTPIGQLDAEHQRAADMWATFQNLYAKDVD